MNRENTWTLDTLAVGEGATVLSVAEGGMRRRFLDVGFVPGTRVDCVGKSPFGDPSAYRVRGAVIAVRKKDARAVTVKKEPQ